MLSSFFIFGSLICVLLCGSGWGFIYMMMSCLVGCFSLNLYGELVGYVVMGLDMGGDSMSFGLAWLSLWVVVLMLLGSISALEGKGSGYFKMLMVLIGLLLMGVFLSLDLFMFYLFFESVLIPTYILIMGWGYQPERLQAGLYLMFYTLLASLPLLVVLLLFSAEAGSLSGGLMVVSKTEWVNFGVYLAGIIAFLVKLPLFMFHLWLPKAHVEAPVAGSMLLAGILLKMGGYGLFRFSAYFMMYFKVLGAFWVSLGLMGGIYLSLICLRQSDIKSLIAYSSVVHMGLVVGGLTTLNSLGLMGSYILMVGHGLCSSGLFCLANMNYIRISSRSLVFNSGLMNLLPSGALVWFLLSSSNMSAPPSLNLFGEIQLIGSLMSWGLACILGLVGVAFFSASYCLYLYSSTQHGESGKSKYSGFSLMGSDFLLVFLHWGPLNLLFLSVDLFLL